MMMMMMKLLTGCQEGYLTGKNTAVLQCLSLETCGGVPLAKPGTPGNGC